MKGDKMFTLLSILSLISIGVSLYVFGDTAFANPGEKEGFNGW
jgi:hypothetical protein|nr:MAG TPA: hypothetical protein [Caudoviricetes sp.]